MGIETMVALSLGTSLIGGAARASGEAQAAAAQQQQANYQAQVAENNAALAKQQAVRLRAQGEEASFDAARKTGQRVGAQRAAFAAAGVDVNSGTAAAVQDGTRDMGRLDQLRIYGSAIEQAYAAEVQGVNYQNEAALTRMRGQHAKEAGSTRVASSLIDTAGSFSSKWLGFQRTGAIPSWSE